MLSVANYHYIREDFSAPYPSIFGLSPKQFRKQLEALAKHGSFISLKELLEFRQKPFDRNYLLITFDDGLKEQYELAKPILEELGIPYIFFINTANFQEQQVSLVHKIHLLRSQVSSEELLNELAKHTNLVLDRAEEKLAIFHYNYDEEKTAILKYLLNFKLSLPEQQAFINPLFQQLYDESFVAAELYFTDEMLQDLHSQDVLGSHSHHHLPLGQLTREDLKHELEMTQAFFMERFGSPSKAISYPYGSYEACRGIKEEVAAFGFELGFTMERATNASLQEDSLLLSRYDCNDLPLGKNDLFTGTSLFQKPELRRWKDEM